MVDSASLVRAALRNKADRRAFLRLQKQVKDLADAVVNVNAKEQRFVTTMTDFAGGAATVDVNVTWPTPWPDAAYGVLIPLPTTGPLAIGKVFAALKAGSKTTAGCVVTVVATQAVATLGLEVVGIRTITATV